MDFLRHCLVLAAALAAVPAAAATAPLTRVSVGGDTTCVVYFGAAFCWGANANGQVGNNTTTVARSPAAVVGLSSGVTEITTGGSHSCAVVRGGAWCWGANGYGQLGNDTIVDSPVPVPVAGLDSGVSLITAGDLHTCALVRGGVKCWGSGGYGQLGDGATTFSAKVPVDVVGMTSSFLQIRSLSAGRQHTCASGASGFVSCWGRGDSGEIGNGTTTFINTTPKNVVGFGGVMTADVEAGGSFTCATKFGQAMCWGFGGSGQLGNGASTNSAVPVFVGNAGTSVSSLSAGSGLHACAVASGAASCWGFNNAGQLGNPGFPGGSNSAVAVPGLGSGVQQISAGGLHTCAIASAGLWCWGGNLEGQLGNGGQASSNVPLLVVPAAVATALVATPARVDFGGQSMRTRSPATTVTIQNNGASTLTVLDFGTTEGFEGSTDCVTLAPGGTCTFTLAFVPTLAESMTGFAALETNAGFVVVDLAGLGERSLVTHYYRSILRRAPDGGGKAFWESEAVRVAGLGANVNETWFSMAQGFFASAEYGAFARDDAGFVTDLYTTFFNRAPDGGGLAFWTGNLAQGMPREVALSSFMFSAEFVAFAQAIFGNTSARAEVDTVVDFYRGVLSRLPDSDGFAAWRQQFRTAQCAGPAAVTAQADAISRSFLQGAEYAARNRTDAQYVGDLYNAFLRRGGDLAGVKYWIGAVAGGAAAREQARQAFVASPEFQGRVQAIIAQGCLP